MLREPCGQTRVSTDYVGFWMVCHPAGDRAGYQFCAFGLCRNTTGTTDHDDAATETPVIAASPVGPGPPQALRPAGRPRARLRPPSAAAPDCRPCHSEYAIRSARSLARGMPAKLMLVPGTDAARILQIDVEILERPIALLRLHRRRIVEAGLRRLRPPDDTPEVRADPVRLALAEGVAGHAFLGGVLAAADVGAGKADWQRIVGHGRAGLGAGRRLLGNRDLVAGLGRRMGANSAPAAMLSDSRIRQVPSTAPRTLLSSKESIADRLPLNETASG